MYLNKSAPYRAYTLSANIERKDELLEFQKAVKPKYLAIVATDMRNIYIKINTPAADPLPILDLQYLHWEQGIDRIYISNPASTIPGRQFTIFVSNEIVPLTNVIFGFLGESMAMVSTALKGTGSPIFMERLNVTIPIGGDRAMSVENPFIPDPYYINDLFYTNFVPTPPFTDWSTSQILGLRVNPADPALFTADATANMLWPSRHLSPLPPYDQIIIGTNFAIANASANIQLRFWCYREFSFTPGYVRGSGLYTVPNEYVEASDWIDLDDFIAMGVNQTPIKMNFYALEITGSIAVGDVIDLYLFGSVM